MSNFTRNLLVKYPLYIIFIIHLYIKFLSVCPGNITLNSYSIRFSFTIYCVYCSLKSYLRLKVSVTSLKIFYEFFYLNFHLKMLII